MAFRYLLFLQLHSFQQAISLVQKIAFDLLSKKVYGIFFRAYESRERNVMLFHDFHRINVITGKFTEASVHEDYINSTIYPLNLNNIKRQWPLATPT